MCSALPNRKRKCSSCQWHLRILRRSNKSFHLQDRGLVSSNVASYSPIYRGRVDNLRTVGLGNMINYALTNGQSYFRVAINNVVINTGHRSPGDGDLRVSRISTDIFGRCWNRCCTWRCRNCYGQIAFDERK